MLDPSDFNFEQNKQEAHDQQQADALSRTFKHFTLEQMYVCSYCCKLQVVISAGLYFSNSLSLACLDPA